MCGRNIREVDNESEKLERKVEYIPKNDIRRYIIVPICQYMCKNDAEFVT